METEPASVIEPKMEWDRCSSEAVSAFNVTKFWLGVRYQAADLPNRPLEFSPTCISHHG
jgi:hypothetical protein